MSYLVKSLATRSFWRHALFSGEALGKMLAVVGGLYLFMELMDFLSVYTKDRYSKYAIIPIFLVAVVWVIISRRPITRISVKPPGKDYVVEVKIGDLFEESGDVVISSNTTFDTDIAGGLISPDSLQGQVALKVFQGNTAEIDRQLDVALERVPYQELATANAKRREYPIGTVAKISTPQKLYYFVAMARLNEHGNARSTVRDVEDALDGLWQSVATQGELRALVVPLMGTGRGRLEPPRKKVIERIAQSFADASRDKTFTNRLKIMIKPEDADNFSVNLFEVRDYLTRSLHI